jgi:NAD(P)-dependent dehydrogenase (short-subunit alcohol dehydrogenase family)
MKLKDKVVVVTGSGSGIGAAFARRFSEEGARVVVTDQNAAGVDAVAADIDSVGLTCDITKPENIHAVAELARETYGEIDVWYSNAGYSGPRTPGELGPDEVWELGWELHVMSHVRAAREVLPSMLERGDGYLLNTASVTAVTLQPDKAFYTVSKAGALSLAEWLAATYGHRGVKVSCFCPGAMLTPMLLSNNFPEDHPILKTALTPEAVAELLVNAIDHERFLVTDSDVALNVLGAKASDYDGWLGTMGQVAAGLDKR